MAYSSSQAFKGPSNTYQVRHHTHCRRLQVYKQVSKCLFNLLFLHSTHLHLGQIKTFEFSQQMGYCPPVVCHCFLLVMPFFFLSPRSAIPHLFQLKSWSFFIKPHPLCHLSQWMLPELLYSCFQIIFSYYNAYYMQLYSNLICSFLSYRLI